MGNIGRRIAEGDWPHSADYNSMLYAVSGLGYVMTEGDQCAPSVTGPLTVGVNSGRICIGLPYTKTFSGDSVTLSSNVTESYGRYDLLFLEWDSLTDTVELKALGGVPSEHPTHPDLPIPPARKVAPIAVVYFAPYSNSITTLKDTRTVVDELHTSTPGQALDVTNEAVLNINVDDLSITKENDFLELKDGGVSIPKLGFLIGPGLETVPDVLQVKPGHGLQIDTEYVLAKCSDISGGGLEDDGTNKLQVVAGDGLELSAGRVKITEGQGTILRGTTPNRVLDVYVSPGKGLDFDTTGVGRLYVKASDLAGTGIEDDGTNKLQVVAGDGLELSAGGVKITEGKGTILRGITPDRVLDVYISPGKGLDFDTTGVGRLYVKASDLAGAGIEEDLAGKLQVTAGNGLARVGGRVDIDPGRGIRTNNPGGEPPGQYKLEVYWKSGGGLDVDTTGSGRLYVDANTLAGDGLSAESLHKLMVETGNGLKISSERVVIDYDFGLKMTGPTPNGVLDVNPSDFTGQGLYVDTNNKIRCREGFGIIASTMDLTVDMGDIRGAMFNKIVDETFAFTTSETEKVWSISNDYPVSVYVSLTGTDDQYVRTHWRQHSSTTMRVYLERIGATGTEIHGKIIVLQVLW